MDNKEKHDLLDKFATAISSNALKKEIVEYSATSLFTSIKYTLHRIRFDGTASEETSEVFKVWLDSLPEGSRRKLTPERRIKIQARLREYPFPDVLAAVRGWVYDEWSDRPKHNDIVILLRNGRQLEKFRDMFNQFTAAPEPVATLGPGDGQYNLDGSHRWSESEGTFVPTDQWKRQL